MVEYLYTLGGGGDDRPLYVGISDDWSRRLRQHALTKPWVTPEVHKVTIERFPDRTTVVEAERLAIRSQRPSYNVQHNLGPLDEPPAGSGWTVEKTILAVIITAVAVYIVYKAAEFGVAKYQAGQQDRREFKQWKEEKDQAPTEPASTPTSPEPPVAAPTAMGASQATPPPIRWRIQPAPVPEVTITHQPAPAEYAAGGFGIHPRHDLRKR